MVTEEDFLDAERELVPSVSLGELEHYQSVRAQFEKVEDKDKGKARSNGNVNGMVSSGLAKGNGKEKMVDRKGKGKEVARWDEADGYEATVGSNGHAGKGKGRMQEVDMGFHESVDDDEGLY